MLKKFLSVLLLLCFSLMILYGCNANPKENIPETARAARTAVWQQLSAGASSATVAVMDGGQIVYQETFGMRERENSLPVDADTQFNIGSVSKIFTAAGILQLVQDGKVDLDRPVTDYLPQFFMEDERYRDITVRMLLNHSSGLPGSYAKNAYTTVEYPELVKDTLQYLSKSTLVDDPGKISIYCNNGFILAQAIIEEVSGISYSDYMETNIFSKAGMRDTSCYFRAGNQNIARTYHSSTGRMEPVEYSNLMGTGGISSTAVDLCMYAKALLSGKIMDQNLLNEYLKPQYAPKTVPKGVPLFQYGLGWDTAIVQKYAEQDIRVLSKNGGTSQYSSVLYVLPEGNIAVSVIFAGKADATGVGDIILQTLLEEKGIIKEGNETATPPGPALLPEAYLEYAGIYGSNERITQVAFDTERDSMILSFFKEGGFVEVGAYPYKEDGYFYLGNGARLTLAQSGEGVKCLLIHDMDGDGGSVWAEKLDPGLGQAQTDAFEGKSWIPINLDARELTVFPAKTGALPGLPGYIYIYFAGTYAPYALAAEDAGVYSMKYARDQGEPAITVADGQTRLEIVGLVFEDAQQAAPLALGEAVVIKDQDLNEIRSIAADCLFSVTLPENGRIIVIGPGMDVVYDSLIDTEKELTINEGSYVVFAGDQGSAFLYDVQYASGD